MADSVSKIEKIFGTLSTNKNKVTEVTFTSWFGKPAKFDIREWEQDHSRAGKGVTLDENEMKNLLKVLKEMFPEEG
jgi:hypothetical protein